MNNFTPYIIENEWKKEIGNINQICPQTYMYRRGKNQQKQEFYFFLLQMWVDAR